MPLYRVKRPELDRVRKIINPVPLSKPNVKKPAVKSIKGGTTKK